MAEWKEQVQETATKAEEEVKRLIKYLNDEVVPDIRKQSSTALKSAAEQLRALAEKLEKH
jgi:bisphosphoglycerate-dependent phosphoglycerate mutase